MSSPFMHGEDAPLNAAELMCTLLARRLEWHLPGNLSLLVTELNRSIAEIENEVDPSGAPNVVSIRRASQQNKEQILREFKHARDVLAGSPHRCLRAPRALHARAEGACGRVSLLSARMNHCMREQ